GQPGRPDRWRTGWPVSGPFPVSADRPRVHERSTRPFKAIGREPAWPQRAPSRGGAPLPGHSGDHRHRHSALEGNQEGKRASPASSGNTPRGRANPEESVGFPPNSVVLLIPTRPNLVPILKGGWGVQVGLAIAYGQKPTLDGERRFRCALPACKHELASRKCPSGR